MANPTELSLEELFSNIQKDFQIDETDLGKEAVRTSDLFIKYIRMYSEQKLRLQLMENQKRKLYQKKYDYYSGNGTPEEYKERPFDLKLKTVAGIQKHIETDPEVVSLDDKILFQNQKVEVLQECLKTIKSRGYEIKTALDHQKFLNGY